MSKLEVQLANAEVAYQKQLQGNLVELNRQLSEAIMRVRELHQPIQLYETLHCEGCESVSFDNSTDGVFPPTLYPCPTIKALDGES